MSEVEVYKAIEERVAMFVSAYNSGDTDSLKQLFTGNCKLMAPGQAVTSGREGVEKMRDAMIAMGYIGVKISVSGSDVLNDGDRLCTPMIFTLGKQDGTELSGKGVYIWKMIDGKYYIDTDLWNYDEEL